MNNKAKADEKLCEQLKIVADKGKPAVRALLMAHRGTPYFDDLLNKAKTMHLLDTHFACVLRS